MKTKISHSLALLAIVMAAVLIENAFLQSMAINNGAYDLITKITISESSPQYLSLMKTTGKVALAEMSLPLFPGAKRLTFSDNGQVSYRLDAPLRTVAKFYNQTMIAAGWQRIKSSAQAAATQKKFDKIMIALAENPITKKTEAVFYYKPVGANDILGVQTALAEEAILNNAPQEPVQFQPQTQPLMPLSNNQINQTVPINNQTQPFRPENQPMQIGPGQFNNSSNAPQPTCRVNGVETPGACPQYNNGSEMKGMEFGRPGGQSERQQGPSEEDMKKMDERRFKDMKRGLSQFTRSAQMMKKNVAKTKAVISKCGVNMPEELNNALNSIDGLVEKVNNAQNADELDQVVGDIEDVSSVMQDWGPRMGDLHRLCQMLKQADRDFKQLDRSLSRYQAKNSSKIDISALLIEYKNNIETMRQALSQARELAKTDADEALSKIEDDFYGNMDNVRNSEQAVNMVLNIGQGIRQASAEIKNIDRNIKNLKRKKIDTAEIEAQAAEFKQQLEEIKDMIKSKFDVEDLISKVETAFNAREQIYDAMQEYGLGIMAPQIKENKSLNMQVNLPDSFKKQDGNEKDSSNQSDNPNDAGMNNLQPQNMMPKF